MHTFFWATLYLRFSIHPPHVLHTVKEESNTLHKIKMGEVSWIGHILRRNRILKRVIKGKIEVKVRRGRRRKQLLDNLKDKRGDRKSKQEALESTLR